MIPSDRTRHSTVPTVKAFTASLMELLPSRRPSVPFWPPSHLTCLARNGRHVGGPGRNWSVTTAAGVPSAQRPRTRCCTLTPAITGQDTSRPVVLPAQRCGGRPRATSQVRYRQPSSQPGRAQQRLCVPASPIAPPRPVISCQGTSLAGRPLILPRQGTGEPGLEVQYPDPAGRNGDAGHGLSPQRADPGSTLFRSEVPCGRELIL